MHAGLLATQARVVPHAGLLAAWARVVPHAGLLAALARVVPHARSLLLACLFSFAWRRLARRRIDPGAAYLVSRRVLAPTKSCSLGTSAPFGRRCVVRVGLM